MTAAALQLVAVVTLLAMCAGCNRASHDMQDQPRYNPAMSSPLFADLQAERPPVAGSVVRSAGDRAWVSSGRAASPEVPAEAPPVVDDVMLKRGANRYAIYCLPCHGTTGDGDGPVVQRGFPAPASFAATALRLAPDSRLHDAILHGAGVMYPFADRVSAADAWAIVAYLRGLQRDRPMAAAAAPTSTPASGVPR